MEEHEEIHSEVRWRRVCAIFDDHPVWKAVLPEERKDVFEDVVFALAKREKVRVKLSLEESTVKRRVYVHVHDRQLLREGFTYMYMTRSD